MTNDRRPVLGDQFRGLPMEDLIGGPLMAARDAQAAAAKAAAEFRDAIASPSPADEPAEPAPDA